MIEHRMAALLMGFLLDWLFGDPSWIPHPVIGMGKTIGACEKAIRKWCREQPGLLLLGGGCLVVSQLLIWGSFSYVICGLAYGIHPGVGVLVEGFLCFQLLAARGLKTESMKVYQALRQGTLPEARQAVSMIVGRDTEHLSREGVTKAAVETVAENLSDGVIAPLCFMALGGAVGGYLYKAVNTMDSMVGYKNDRYLYFGRAAARLDDVCNYIPARLSALFLVAACPLAGLNGKAAWQIWRRDRKNHASPNSAQTEAAAAGALQIQLAGDAWYFGKRHQKPTIGDPVREVEPEDIVRVNRLMMAAAQLALAGLLGLLLSVVILKKFF